jgi:repressor LexA
MALTKKQKDILEFVRKHIHDQGYAPTLREIGEHFGLSSVATVHKHLKALEEKGELKREEGRARQVEVRPPQNQPHLWEVPLLGLVAAGLPIEALEQPDTISLPEDMLGRGETFVLQVKGDSMIEDHILNGDRIVVEKKVTAENGEIVVALIGNEATVKRLYREGERVRLQPANSSMAPIYVQNGDLKIQGVVTGVLRKMRK